MKVAAFANRLAPFLPLLACPLCQTPFALEGGALRCRNGHCYDLSARGYVNLATGRDQRGEKYGARLFESRGRVFAGGFYLPVLQAIETMLEAKLGPAPFSLADVGCGEGYYARALARRFPAARVFGLDLSRDGIHRAAGEGGDVCWLVADLKKPPFCDHALDIALDVLTPADYRAFGKMLKPNGELIKVIPGKRYLTEIRQAVKELLRNQDFANDRVLEHLKAHGEVLEQVTVERSFPLTPAQSADFLRMTPMTFSVPEEALEAITLPAITIHMEILRVQL